MQILENISIKNHNTFGIDVTSRYFVEYTSEKKLLCLLKSDFLKDNSFFNIGGGSNLLFTKDFDGVLLHSKINSIEVIKEENNDIFVRVGAGVVWDDFVAFCVEKNWYGCENLSLIPGEVGASPVQNIGAYGIEAKDLIFEVEGLCTETCERKVLKNNECQFGYRNSIFKHELKNRYIVTYVTYKLSKTPNYCLGYGSIQDELNKLGEINLQNIRKAIILIREAKLPDPIVEGNAGSFFKNPVVSKEKFDALKKEYPHIPHFVICETEIKIPAAWLIEQCGWKGKAIGDAAVHKHQPLVLVNKGNASGNDILNLSKQICESVKSKFDIEISPEVIVL